MFRRRLPLASKVLLALALVSGALAFVLVRGYERRVEALRPAAGPSVAVVVAGTDLRRGTTLSEAMLASSSMPRAFRPPGAVASPAAVAGRVLTADIAAGEVLTSSRLAANRVGPVAALVPSGLSAVVLPSELPAETVRAGDRVDVYATYGGGRAYTDLVASGLEVLRVLDASSPSGGIASGDGSGNGASLVVLVDATSAERLAYARAFGQLEITILGPDAATGSP